MTSMAIIMSALIVLIIVSFLISDDKKKKSISVMDIVKGFFNGIGTFIAFLIKWSFMLAVLGGILYVIYSILTSDAVTTIRTGSAWSETKDYKAPEAKVDYLSTLSVKPSIKGTAFMTIESNATYRFVVSGRLKVDGSYKGTDWTSYTKPNGRWTGSSKAFYMPSESSPLEESSFPLAHEYEGKAIIKINDKLYAVSSDGQEVEASIKKGDVISLSINLPSLTDEISNEIKSKWTVTTYRVTYKQ